MKPAKDYKLGKLSTSLKWIGFFSVLSNIGVASAHFSQANLFSRFIQNPRSVTEKELLASDDLITGFSVPSFFFWIIFFILAITVAWRATKNLVTWGIPVKRGPGWAIAGWFVPVMFFWVPFQIIRDAFRLAPKMSQRAQEVSFGIWSWTFIFLWIEIILSRASSAIVADPLVSPSELQTSALMDGIASSLSVLVTIGFIISISKITDRHDLVIATKDREIERPTNSFTNVERFACPSCGVRVANDEANFCQGCGGSISNTRTCSACSSVLEKDAKFCHRCGSSQVTD